MKKIILGGLLTGLTVTNAFSGGMMSAAADNPIVPQTAFFGGLGGGWSSSGFWNQDVYGKGTSYSPPYGIHTAQVGSAAGATSLKLDSQSALAPVVQAGYFQHFSDSQWMEGGSFLTVTWV